MTVKTVQPRWLVPNRNMQCDDKNGEYFLHFETQWENRLFALEVSDIIEARRAFDARPVPQPKGEEKPMIRIAVAENSPEEMARMTDYLERYRQEHELVFQVSCFADGADLMEYYQPVYDVIFLDIEMPNMDGMATARRIRNVDAEVILVFVTHMAQYALKGYEVRAMDFLVKPLEYEAFAFRMDLLLQRVSGQNERELLLSNRNETRKISVDRLIYVEANKHKMCFHTESGVFETNCTMKWVEEQLEGADFFRCDHGLLVNLRYVTWVGQNELLAGGNRLKVSRPKRKQFMQALADYLGGTL